MFRQAFALLRDPDRAKDVVQEVTLRLWQNPKGLDASANPRAYCLASVRNEALSVLRSATRFESLDSAASLPESAPADDSDWMRELIARLPESQRRVFELKTIRDMEYEEIASLLSTSEANVRQLLSRARKTLRRLYAQYI